VQGWREWPERGGPQTRSSHVQGHSCCGDVEARECGFSYSFTCSCHCHLTRALPHFFLTPRAAEPDYVVSVPSSTPPPASPTKPSQARSSAPVHVRVSTVEPPRSSAVVGRVSSAPASRASTPAKSSSSAASLMAGSQAGSRGNTPPARSPAASRAPPSSSKRMLAPNGQPRKIPMAMDFNDGEHACLPAARRLFLRLPAALQCQPSCCCCEAVAHAAAQPLPHRLTPVPPRLPLSPPPSSVQSPPATSRTVMPTAGQSGPALRRSGTLAAAGWAPLPPLPAAAPLPLWKPSVQWWATTAPPTARVTAAHTDAAARRSTVRRSSSAACYCIISHTLSPPLWLSSVLAAHHLSLGATLIPAPRDSNQEQGA
jgi:hypothetical protein